ncbi:MAG: sulfide/dihydroorotate dehydrogenase-like FAD/NAD-binding protein [Bryobacteraceae bacterium]|nr:sulfide/dihydroorotate dehydrogenase-like FAD/NAD-binding protein [Bryobacteraceae bacterium]
MINQIIDRRELAPAVTLLEVVAPRIQRRWKAGQFVIVRPTDHSERIPLTIMDSSPERQSISMVVQAVGKTTQETVALQCGEAFADLAGPLGEPATIPAGKRVVCLAGGVGVAELLPVARAYRDAGNQVIVLCGARSNEYRILDTELRAGAGPVHWATDDGSFGFHGNVVALLKTLAGPGAFDEGHVIGPIPMMKAAADATRDWHLKLYASLNPVMIDGTGMCGGCRVTVGDSVKFACVDGPEFDAHRVDFDELARRNGAYRTHERLALEHGNGCRIGLDVR